MGRVAGAGFRHGTTVRRVVLTFAALLCLSVPVEAKRIALVIGNDAYEAVTPLQKAVNDARAIADTLERLGFEVVRAENVGRRAMSRAFAEMEKRIEAGDTALFFYAGHGFAIGEDNYLLPVDIPEAEPGDEALVRDESFAAGGLADRLLDAGASAAILVVDACRDNPFARPGTRSIAGTRGLVRPDPKKGMFVMFSAAPRQSALDRLSDGDPDPNSVFTRIFLREIGLPGRPMLDIAKATQEKVAALAATVGHEQMPAIEDAILGEVILNPGDGSIATGATAAFQEGGTSGNLPAMAPGGAARGAPIANFMRSNAGWTVSVSLPEPAIQFGYRIGEDGAFQDGGHLDLIDQTTKQPVPRTQITLPGDQPATTIYVTWRDRRGEEAGVFPLRFDPSTALVNGQMQMIAALPPGALLQARERNLYFTLLLSYRCAIREVRYGIDSETPDTLYRMPACDPDDPYSVPTDAELFRALPEGVRSVSYQITFADGTQTPVGRIAPQ